MHVYGHDPGVWGPEGGVTLKLEYPGEFETKFERL
jgi:hypothetical protein